MKVALIQLRVEKGDISQNIRNHLTWIKSVAAHHPTLIVFPELSLTGYEPTLAKELAMTTEDSRLEPFKKMSDQLQTIIAIGAPLQTDVGIHIGMVIFHPNQPRETYAKQYLHPDEVPYFVPGTEQHTLSLNGKMATPAICYESLRPEHLDQCMELGTTLYIASVSKHEKGIQKAHTYYSRVAREKGISVVMVNSVGYCDNFMSAGQSAIWNSKGDLLNTLGSTEEGYLKYDVLDAFN